MSQLDPFTLQIIRNHLYSTTEEMIQTTVRTAYSPTFAEGYDFSCALFDRTGRMVIQSRGIGVHLGSLVKTTEAVVRKYPSPAPGNVYITNHPYLATHQSDVVRAIALQNSANSALRYPSSQAARLILPRKDPFVVSFCMTFSAICRSTARLAGPWSARLRC